MKPVLIHTHFHKRRTGVTRSIENVFSFFESEYETYIYGNIVKGKKISFLKLLKILFSDTEVIVHCHRNNEILKMLFFRFFGAKFKLISSRHAATKPSDLTFKLLQKSDKVVTLIKSMSDELDIENTIIGHGINVDQFVPNPQKTLADIKQKNTIICAGRVRKAKGQIILLEAAKILKTNTDWALIIVGKVDKPTFLDELKAISKKHDIENQVYFIKETSDIISYYQASKIAIVPSYSEGFSLVTAEAMSCGCSVIATKNVGVHNDLITDSKNGYLFEAGNILELQTILSKLLKNDLPFVGEKARKEILENWSAKGEAKKLSNLYI